MAKVLKLAGNYSHIPPQVPGYAIGRLLLIKPGQNRDLAAQARKAFRFTLLKNLRENAIQHAPEGSVVSVEIQSEALTGRDFGADVDTEQLPLLFERFWRATYRRDYGAGLGLAIYQEIALAHGWCLTAEQAELGQRFRLSNEDEELLP